MTIPTVFFGTASIAVPTLERLVASGVSRVLAVVTQPDRPKGRNLREQASPVKIAAEGLGLPVLQPERARDAGFVETLAKLQPQLLVVIAYGQILPQAILDLARWGGLNIHTSLLPKYRGAAPIQRALLAGETETGVTIIRMDAGMDTGDILTLEKLPIAADDTSPSLEKKLGQIGARLLAETIPGYLAGTIRPTPQPPEGVSYAPKIRKEEGKLSWDRTAADLHNQVRALQPWPGAWCYYPDRDQKSLLKVQASETAIGSAEPGTILAADEAGIVVACGEGALRILRLQKEGGRILSSGEFVHGHRIAVGRKLEG